MHKKAKITYPRFKGIPAVLTAQGFHKGLLDCVEVSVIHCRDGIVINASSREVFHRRRLALPSDSPLLSTLSSSTSSSTLSSSTLLNSSNLPSSLNSPVKGEQDEKVDKIKDKSKKTEENKIAKKKRTKADTEDEKVEILIRDAFGTFKGEVPYYSARIMSIPEEFVPGLEELDERYEEWFGGEDE